MKARCALAVALAVAGCGTQGTSLTAVPYRSGPSLPAAAPPHPLSSSKIRHVVIIVQENRSTDDLFGGLPGAETSRVGRNSTGGRVRLREVLLTAPYDVSHEHSSYLIEHANGKLNGFNLAKSTCQVGEHCLPKALRPYGYVPHAEIAPYFEMAEQYAFGDHMFQTNEGPSFPAHQYIISGTSTPTDNSPLRAASNAFEPSGGFTGGCDSPPGSLVYLIDEAGNQDEATFPCFERITLMDLLERKGLSWRYYESHFGAGLWQAPDAIQHIRYGKLYATDVVSPPSTVLTDIAGGRLANVVWVTPTAKASDHAGVTDGTGPSWVASVVNAIGKSPYWSDTAIFVTWDDWGGWYDHVPPPQYNSYELGFRVPLIVISPYAKTHYVSHVQHEFGSILKFTEQSFGLGSLNTTDVRADNLADCFNFKAAPRRFTPIAAPLGPRYFLNQPPSTEAVDY
ncbi:MAG TPA: alkaline phosphatase family protein [Candidatus Cybelea sp.]|jgi:phospholipase C|nr:alkaline phosphatase family protein [Candidatus Cybelea sp.]